MSLILEQRYPELTENPYVTLALMKKAFLMSLI